MKISTQISALLLITFFCFVVKSSAQVTNTVTSGNYDHGSVWDNGVPSNSGIATIFHPIAINQDLTIEGSCTVNATLIDNPGGSQYKGEIKASGVFTIKADVTFEDEVKFSNFSSGSVNTCATFTTGDLLIENFSTLYISPCSKLIVNGNLTIKNDIGIQNDGEIIVNGDIDVSNLATVFGTGLLEATGCVTFNNSASIFSSSTDCCNCFFGTPLPIKLLSFEAEIDNSSTKLTWVTASEINNDFFTIERSENGIDFEFIDKVAGSGNSENLKEYATYDDSPLEGTSYYRLKQTDFDGVTEYFKLVAVDFNTDNKFSLSIYPNPCLQNCTITLNEYQSNNKQILIELYDAFGKRIVNGISPNYNGKNNSFQLNQTNKLTAGIYLVKVLVGGKSQTSKLIIN